MNRLEALKAGATMGTGTLLTACGGGLLRPASGLAGSSRMARTCTGKQWDFEWRPLPKTGGYAYANVLHKQEPDCAFKVVGGIGIDFLLGKYHQILKDELSFFAGPYKATYDMSTLEDTFHKGAIVKLFKKWYYRCGLNDWSGNLYDEHGTLLAKTWSSDWMTRSVITIYSQGSQARTWHHTWGNVWKQYGAAHPDLSSACIGALALEFGLSVAWVVALLASPAGPLEWFGFAGITVSLLGSAIVVTNECNK